MLKLTLKFLAFALAALQPISALAIKPFPSGVYESAGPIRNGSDNVVARTPLIPGQEGVLVRVSWSLCGDDQNCLLEAIQLNLDSAQSLGLKVALGVGDGDMAPPAVKSRCQLFDFSFQGMPATMCVPWDSRYQADKAALLDALGQRFDSHPALAHVYFTAACSTNGFEGHCRVDPNSYTDAGYTAEVMATAYVAIMQMYLDAFATTPITFEAHSILDRVDHWDALWAAAASSQQVGVAAWWCAERLSLSGSETVPVWPLIQTIASSTYSVCQTVGSFSEQPWRFTDLNLNPPLDYGTEGDWNSIDVANAFADTLEWVSGIAVHAGQGALPAPFAAIEVWTVDMNNPSMQGALHDYLDAVLLFGDGFE
jgi:hypothetical protein